ncbi:MAG: hypothetical protein ABIJ84_02620 [bacterium]
MNVLESISKYQKFIFFSCLILAVFSFIDKTLAVGTIFIAFLTSVTFIFINKNKEEKQRKILSALFIIVFLLHILGVLFLYYANFQPFSGGYGDFVVYERQAQEIVDRVQQGNLSLQGVGIGHYYPVIIGYLYAFTVSSMLIGQILNAWLVAIIVIFVYLIVREIGGSEKQGFLTGLITSAYPSLAFYGSLLLKDALVVLLCLVGLLLTIKIIKRFSWIIFSIFYITLTALIHFRFYVGYAVMFSFIISWFLVSAFNLKKRIIYGIILLVLLGFSPQFLGYGYFGFKNFKAFLNPETITYYREIVYALPTQSQPADSQPADSQPADSQPADSQPADSQPADSQPADSQPADSQPIIGRDSTTIVKTGFENPFTFLKNTSLSFINSLFGPFPWQMTQKKHFLVLSEVIAWYFLFFFIIKGIKKSIKDKYKVILPLIIFSILLIGVLSLFMTNFGIITRIRMPAFLSLLCLFPLGFEKLKNIKIPFLEKYFI